MTTQAATLLPDPLHQTARVAATRNIPGPGVDNRYVFSSIGDFADACENTPRAEGCARSSEGAEHSNWYGGMTLERAIKTGQNGGYWPEALADMKPLDLDSARLLEGREMDAPSYEATVAGFMPIVPNALLGLPDSMLGIEDRPQPHKMLRIGVSCIPLAGVSREATFNRGNAILSIIDALETTLGYSCELVACWPGKARGMPTNITEITIKQSDQFWDPASVAFAVCHAAMGRRLGFRWLEVVAPEMTRASYGTHYNISEAAQDYAPEDRFDLTLEGLRHDGGFTSRKEAIETLLPQFIKAIEARESSVRAN